MMQVFGILETETKEQFRSMTCGFLKCKGYKQCTLSSPNIKVLAQCLCEKQNNCFLKLNLYVLSPT